MSERYTTDLTENEIDIKVRENIKEYLREYQEYTDMLSKFYLDESKSFKDLDHELTMILASKMIYEDLKHYIVKEVVI